MFGDGFTDKLQKLLIECNDPAVLKAFDRNQFIKVENSTFHVRPAECECRILNTEQLKDSQNEKLCIVINHSQWLLVNGAYNVLEKTLKNARTVHIHF